MGCKVCVCTLHSAKFFKMFFFSKQIIKIIVSKLVNVSTTTFLSFMDVKDKQIYQDPRCVVFTSLRFQRKKSW